MGCLRLTYYQDFVPLRLAYSIKSEQQKKCANLSYFGARYYMPELSIWSAVDPLADETPSWTPYHYCHNNPIVLVDPDGQSAGSPDEWNLNMETGNVTWVSDKGGSSTQHVNVIGSNGSSTQNVLPGNGFNVSSFTPNESVTLTSNGFSNDYQYTASSLLPGNISSTTPEVTPTGNQRASTPSQPKATTDAAAPWMSYAMKEIGVIAGNWQGLPANPDVVKYLNYAGIKTKNDNTMWCGAFVNWCLGQADISGAGAGANNYLKWGKHLDTPIYGAIAVFKRGHVGFYMGTNKDKTLKILHGNWSHRVKISSGKYDPIYNSDIKEYRYPNN